MSRSYLVKREHCNEGSRGIDSEDWVKAESFTEENTGMTRYWWGILYPWRITWPLSHPALESGGHYIIE